MFGGGDGVDDGVEMCVTRWRGIGREARAGRGARGARSIAVDRDEGRNGFLAGVIVDD